MSEPAFIEGTVELQASPAAERSAVRIEENSKGQVQVKIAVCEGVTEAEMERLRLLAIKTYDATHRVVARQS